MSDLPDRLTTGERLRLLRERRGMSRPVLAGLVGRSVAWLRKVEDGERTLEALPMLLRIAQVLRLADVNELIGGDVSVPVPDWGKVTHPAVPALREAVHAPLFAEPDAASVPVDELAGRVARAWRVWHTAAHQRSEVGAVLPELLAAAHAAVRTADGPERRKAYRAASEAYALAQQFAAHVTEPELYWVIVDRARHYAELADEPVPLASAAWITGNGLRAQGHMDAAMRLASDAAENLRPLLEGGTDELRGVFGALCLHAAVTAAEDGRDGDAWRWHAEAAHTAERMPGYAHSWTMFGAGNVAVHAVTIGVLLRTPGAALRSAEVVDPASLPSVERRSRLYLDAAKSQHARGESAGALHYLRTAYDTSPEAVRYVPSGRALASALAREARGPLRREAAELAEAVAA